MKFREFFFDSRQIILVRYQSGKRPNFTKKSVLIISLLTSAIVNTCLKEFLSSKSISNNCFNLIHNSTIIPKKTLLYTVNV